MIVLVPYYPLYVSTTKEDYFRICIDAMSDVAQPEILTVQNNNAFALFRRLWGKSVYAHGRGRPFPELVSLISNITFYDFHNNFIGRSRWAIWARRYLFNRCQHIVVHTDFTKANFIQQGIKPEKITVLPHPVDFGYFSAPGNPQRFRSQWKLGSEPFALCVGIRYHKNPWVMIEAARKAGIRIVLVGFKDEKDIGQWSREFLPDKHLLSAQNKDVIFTGYLKTDELRDAYQACSVYLNSSESDGEVFCIAVYEAAAAGAPLCLPDYGTFEVFRDAALLHNNRNSDQLAVNIKKILSDPDLTHRLRRKSTEIARSLDYDKVIELYRTFFKKVFPPLITRNTRGPSKIREENPSR